MKTGELQIGLLFAYYNFIRNHSAIQTTPAEKAGIIDYGGKTSEKGKWLLIIKRATQNTNFILYYISNVFWYRVTEQNNRY